MIRNQKKYSCSFVASILIILVSCTDAARTFSETNDDVGQPVVFIATIGSQSRVNASDLMSEFYVSAFSGRSNRGSNIKYSWTGSEWISNRSINWPQGDISFWGLSRSFADGNGISNSSIRYNDQHFNYTVDPDTAKILYFASKLNTNVNELGGSVHLEYNNALAIPYFTCLQAIDDVQINIKEVIVHNLQTTGTFKFDANTNSKATWTLVDSLYADYKQVLPSPVTLNPDQTTAVKITDPWIWMCQRPTKWATKDVEPVTIQTADSLHQCYVEIKCQIIKNGVYIWGAASGANQYESVYYPFNTNFRAMGYARPIQLTFTGGYLSDGTPFKPHAGNVITIAQWVPLDVLVDPWEEMAPEDMEF